MHSGFRRGERLRCRSAPAVLSRSSQATLLSVHSSHPRNRWYWCTIPEFLPWRAVVPHRVQSTPLPLSWQVSYSDRNTCFLPAAVWCYCLPAPVSSRGYHVQRPAPCWSSLSRDVCNTGDPQQQAPLFCTDPAPVQEKPTVLRFWLPLLPARAAFPSLPSDRKHIPGLPRTFRPSAGSGRKMPENLQPFFPLFPGVFVFFFSWFQTPLLFFPAFYLTISPLTPSCLFLRNSLKLWNCMKCILHVFSNNRCCCGIL